MDQKDTLRLEILTPDRKVVDLEVKLVAVPGEEGEFGVLPGHAELYALIKPGIVSYDYSGRTHFVAVSWGYSHVDGTSVSVLVENAEPVEEINVDRATKELEKWEKELAGTPSDDKNYPVFERKVERAKARLEGAALLAKK